jgi:hypothetical protein
MASLRKKYFKVLEKNLKKLYGVIAGVAVVATPSQLSFYTYTVNRMLSKGLFFCGISYL